jgi:hypothetical protein
VLGREPLPDGTSADDVIAAIQVAWLAGDFVLARSLVERYLDADGQHCCMRCGESKHAPWNIGTQLMGTFFVCPACATIVTEHREMSSTSGETYMVGPPEPISARAIPRRVEVEIPRKRR